MTSPGLRARSLHFAGTVILLAMTLGAARFTAYRKAEFLAQPLDTISRRIAGFDAIDNPPIDADILRQLRPTSYLSRRYRKAGVAADLLITFYARQRPGESMHSPKHCLPGAGWEIWDYTTLDIRAGGRTFKVNKESISREGIRMVVLYWYQSRERIIASEYIGKILLARDALLQNSTAASIVRIIVPDQPGCTEEAAGFASELIPQLQRCFGVERAGNAMQRTFAVRAVSEKSTGQPVCCLAESLHKLVN
jgi:EpsI family protein